MVAAYEISIPAGQNVTVADMEESITGANTTKFLDQIETELSGNLDLSSYTFSVASIPAQIAAPMSPSPSPMGPSPTVPSPSPSPSPSPGLSTNSAPSPDAVSGALRVHSIGELVTMVVTSLLLLK